MSEEIQNVRLLKGLRRYIGEHKEHYAYMKTTVLCGSRIAPNANAVLLASNGKSSKFVGVTSCKNSWVCPVCSAKLMAKYAAEIACAIDALKLHYNQSALMVTLTVPHTSGMSCSEVTEILYNTWKSFIIHGNKVSNVKYYANAENKFKHAQKKEMKISDKKLKDPFAMFCEEFNCKHRVRVGEFTHGKHGWHPHFHCLFWIDDKKWAAVKDWEAKLLARWEELAKRETLKYWNKKYPNSQNNKMRLEIMYKRRDAGATMLYFSKNDDGSIRKQKSSQYICGWGADKELTGNYRKKATHDEHETPYQILERAVANNDEKAFELYLEYCKATKGVRHARINFSTQSGIKKIIEKYKKTANYVETFKKKFIEAETQPRWQILYAFGKRQWSYIQSLDAHSNILLDLLHAAATLDIDEIEKVLDFYSVPPETVRLINVTAIEQLLNNDHIKRTA